MAQLVKKVLLVQLVRKASQEKWVLLDKEEILDYKEFRGLLENRD